MVTKITHVKSKTTPKNFLTLVLFQFIGLTVAVIFLNSCSHPSPNLNAQLSQQLTVVMATKVLRPGSQRVSFLLVTPESYLSTGKVIVRSYFDKSRKIPHEVKTAHFNPWPYGSRGSYTTDLSFDKIGSWTLTIEAQEILARANIQVEVTEGFGIPDIASKAPRSKNPTLSTFNNIATLTSAIDKDPELYLITIDEAISNPMPTVIVFSTPSFCTSPTCGPQVESVQKLKSKYQKHANFLHIEIYDNPHEVKGNLDQAQISTTVREWNLTNIPGWINESWVFTIDQEGYIVERFEGYATTSELEQSLLAILN